MDKSGAGLRESEPKSNSTDLLLPPPRRAGAVSCLRFARGREKAPRLRGGLSRLTWLNLWGGRDNHLARLRE